MAKRASSGAAEATRRVEGRAAGRGSDAGGASDGIDLDLRLAVAAALDRSPAGPCPDPEEALWLVEGTGLEPARRAELDLHLTLCRACTITHERLRLAIERQGPPPVAVATGPARLLERLRRLVRFEMPPQLLLVTRRAAKPVAAPGYQRAMAAYARGRYDQALEGLLAARAAGERSPALAFHLGLCLLRADRAAEAAASLAAAVKGAPELGEYRWYHAQAQLAAGLGREALAELGRASRLPGPFREPAKTLAATLREILAGVA